jgi:hypothetical protein
MRGGSRPRLRTALPRLTAGCPHRDGSTGMSWWRVPVPPRPHRSCKDQLHPCALPVTVSRVSAALTSPAFQTDAFTGLAFWTSGCAMRNFAIWRGPAESNRYQCAGSAWHSQYTRSAIFNGYLPIPSLSQICRKMVGNRGIEPRMHTGAGFTDPLSHQTWRYPECAGDYRRPKPAAYFSSSTSQYRKSRHVSCKKFGGKCRCAAIS